MNLTELPIDILDLIIMQTKIKKYYFEKYFKKYLVEYYQIIKINRWFYNYFTYFKPKKVLIIIDNINSCNIT